MSDDLIKRDDALAACDIAPPDEWNDYTKGGYDFAAEDCKRNIATLPAVTVGVKPLVWDGIQGDCFIECETAIGTYALQVSDSLERECDWEWSATYRKHGQREITIGQGKFQASKDIAQADYEARILSALTLTPVADSQPAIDPAPAKQVTLSEAEAIREAALREVLALQRLGQTCFDNIEVMKDGWLIHEDDVKALIGEKK